MEVSSTTTQTSVPVTFGQPFKAGNWPSSQGLVATDSTGAAVPLQVDQTASHRDGSVRFAVLSAKVSNLQANQPKLINLFLGAKNTSTQSIPADPDWNLELEAKVYNGSTLVSTWVSRPQDLLKQSIAQGTSRRLNGTVATEYTVLAPFKNSSTNEEHPHLNARLHTRLYENGARIRTDMVLENNWTFKTGPGNITYELNVRKNGQLIHTQPRFTHNHHSRWHKVLWTGATAPQYRIRHHMPYFLASKATWNFDLALRIPDSVLAQEARDLAASDTSPMGRAMLNPYFPSTGGRPEIGALPRWTVLYLLTQDERARASMMANADASAAVPVHYRDEGTGQPLDVQRNPNVTVLFGTSSPVLPAVSGSTIWEPDTPHQGSFAYIPYLLTGDEFYLDEMMFWASWNIANVHPISREAGKGLIYENQIRGQAWGMRSIAEAAFALPETHPQKSYFKTILSNNLTWYQTNYTNNAGVSPLGAIENRYEAGRAVPWNNDFMGIVFSWMAENDEPKSKDILDWFSRFNVGRYLAESDGFCTVKAPGYYWWIRDTGGRLITTWRELFARNYPEAVNSPCSSLAMNVEAYPATAEGYAAISRASLASAVNAGVTNASSAYTRWKGFTPLIDAAFLSDPTWAIVPR
ncbi:hypothetical protein F9K07_14000 [Hydrogenophaga sp. BPS33]|nr:hypothetical protein F9K07_14000 [Hydrogenophaga sp. BPS33]